MIEALLSHNYVVRHHRDKAARAYRYDRERFWFFSEREMDRALDDDSAHPFGVDWSIRIKPSVKWESKKRRERSKQARWAPMSRSPEEMYNNLTRSLDRRSDYGARNITYEEWRHHVIGPGKS